MGARPSSSSARKQPVTTRYVVALEAVAMRDVARVGGKNASLSELLQHLGQAASL